MAQQEKNQYQRITRLDTALREAARQLTIASAELKEALREQVGHSWANSNTLDCHKRALNALHGQVARAEQATVNRLAEHDQKFEQQNKRFKSQDERFEQVAYAIEDAKAEAKKAHVELEARVTDAENEVAETKAELDTLAEIVNSDD